VATGKIILRILMLKHVLTLLPKQMKLEVFSRTNLKAHSHLFNALAATKYTKHHTCQGSGGELSPEIRRDTTTSTVAVMKQGQKMLMYII